MSEPYSPRNTREKQGFKTSCSTRAWNNAIYQRQLTRFGTLDKESHILMYSGLKTYATFRLLLPSSSLSLVQLIYNSCTDIINRCLFVFLCLFFKKSLQQYQEGERCTVGLFVQVWWLTVNIPSGNIISRFLCSSNLNEWNNTFWASAYQAYIPSIEHWWIRVFFSTFLKKKAVTH